MPETPPRCTQEVAVSLTVGSPRWAARALTETDRGDARQRVIDGLRNLHVHLLEHLDYEELRTAPTIRRLESLAVPGQ